MKSKALVWHYLRKSVGFFAVALVFSILNTTLNSLIPQVVRVAVDFVTGEQTEDLPGLLTGILNSARARENPARSLLLFAAVILAVAVLSGVCNYLSRTGVANGSESFIKRLRDRLFLHIQRLPYSWHNQHQTGEIIQRCTSDVDVIRNFVSNQMLEVFRTAFLVILSISIMFSMNVTISLVALAFIPLVLMYSCIFYSKIAKRFRKADEAEGELSSTVQENLTGVRVVRAFGRERYEIDRFDERNDRFANLWIRLGGLLSTYWGLGDLITGLQILCVIVAGVMESVNGRITLGEFLAFVSYNTTLIWPVRGLGRILSEMSKAGVSVNRVADILAAEEEEEDANALRPPMNGDIAFHHINYCYEGQKPVLKDVDFTIPAGSTFAILGGTGSGKSTLMHLLDRLYDLPPECGSITVGGTDISKIQRSWLRRNIGIVLQEPFLFSRTIEENIRATRPGASLEEVRGAARIACVDSAIDGFGSGYETIVGERGVTLSGGQKQRVAIARMLMQQAPIMVFDDSLSAVDTETDEQIREALKANLGNSTVILISHRITTLMQADQILVLEDGAVEEIGTHEELLRKNGIYKKIHDIQMSSGDRSLLEQEVV
ncbi:putative ABC transporter ATP-binding protein [Caprobacter fermentans]|uniref:Putative ABC transporter ATP-binding protein n=1 Tax=Caproicibacter fermentans TaxID=2576756 RepID=A0A6N8I5C5_9FIRM|nr:ABC transporter ATP-binding protein [Caproicibacter fermentans]MVB12713.1 putative ABC transporter ATP-binding protein [Caproicibacter fermentans]